MRARFLPPLSARSLRLVLLAYHPPIRVFCSRVLNAYSLPLLFSSPPTLEKLFVSSSNIFYPPPFVFSLILRAAQNAASHFYFGSSYHQDLAVVGVGVFFFFCLLSRELTRASPPGVFPGPPSAIIYLLSLLRAIEKAYFSLSL